MAAVRGVLVSAPTREELRASILRRHPCYCEDACRCTAGHVERDLDALLAAERERCRQECVTEAGAYVNKGGPAAASALECAKRIGGLR